MQAWKYLKKNLQTLYKNIKYLSVKDTFKKKLKESIAKIKQSPNVFVFAQTTSNIHEKPQQIHKKLLYDNVI